MARHKNLSPLSYPEVRAPGLRLAPVLLFARDRAPMPKTFACKRNHERTWPETERKRPRRRNMFKPPSGALGKLGKKTSRIQLQRGLQEDESEAARSGVFFNCGLNPALRQLFLPAHAVCLPSSTALIYSRRENRFMQKDFGSLPAQARAVSTSLSGLTHRSLITSGAEGLSAVALKNYWMGRGRRITDLRFILLASLEEAMLILRKPDEKGKNDANNKIFRKQAFKA